MTQTPVRVIQAPNGFESVPVRCIRALRDAADANERRVRRGEAFVPLWAVFWCYIASVARSASRAERLRARFMRRRQRTYKNARHDGPSMPRCHASYLHCQVNFHIPYLLHGYESYTHSHGWRDLPQAAPRRRAHVSSSASTVRRTQRQWPAVAALTERRAQPWFECDGADSAPGRQGRRKTASCVSEGALERAVGAVQPLAGWAAVPQNSGEDAGLGPMTALSSGCCGSPVTIPP
jgi:hypothetical protein